jgi:hypothetical protein
MKRTIDAIDLQQLEVRNKSEWDKMQNEIGQLKDELNSKKSTQVMKTEREISEIKRVIDELATKQAQSQENHSRDAFESLAALRVEMDELKADLKNKSIDANNLIQEIEILKQDGQKHKAGLKKFFSKRISSWTHPKLDEIVSLDETEAGDQIYKSNTNASDGIATLRPPSLTARRYTKMMANAKQSSTSRNIVQANSSSSSEPSQQEKDGEEPLVVIERTGSSASRISKKSANGSRPPLAPAPKASQVTVETVASTDSKSVVTARTTSTAISGFDKMSSYRKDVSPEVTIKAKGNELPEAAITEQEVVLDKSSKEKIEAAEIASAALTQIAENSKVYDHSDTGSITSAGQDDQRDEAPPSPSRTASSETNDTNDNSTTTDDAKDETASQVTTGSKGGLFKRIRSPPKTSLFRKVKSLVDPSTLSSKSVTKTVAKPKATGVTATSLQEIPAFPVVRTLSKTVVNENGDVELETLEPAEDILVAAAK